MRVLLIGAGGHALVVADIVRARVEAGDALRLAGFLDDNDALQGREMGGARVVGRLDERARTPHDAVVVCIGDNAARRRVFDRMAAEGESFATLRHPSTIVGDQVSIGAGSMVCAGVILNPHVAVGRNVIVNTGATVDHHCRIGDHAHVAPGVRLGGAVTVGEGALIGIGAVVLPGIVIGQNAIVGGGAVVIRNVPDAATVAGNPARPVGGA